MRFRYSVKQLAKLAGVSVRALHLYDRIGLLKPSFRSLSRYRFYGEAELLRLQQIVRHYVNIRSFWEVSDPTDLQAAIYKGLGDLYLSDERYTASDGKANPAFAKFMCLAMVYFADTKLK